MQPATSPPDLCQPELRALILQKLAEGCPPSSLGTILTSQHPNYLRALFVGPFSHVSLFFSTGDTNDNDNDYIVHFDEWSIDEVFDQAQTKQRHVTDDERERQKDAVRRCQARASRALCRLEKKVSRWRLFDGMRERQEREALEVVVDDPLCEKPGALENLVDSWRHKLGWIDCAAGYWFDTAAAVIAAQRFKFVAYAPVNNGSDGIEASEGQRIKYFWSEISGMWKTADGMVKEKEKIQRDRNTWLVSEIDRIERDRNTDLMMEGVGFVVPHIYGEGKQSWSVDVWSGGVGRSGQKTTRRRKVKKQVPERMYSSVDFVPEDGGSTVLESLYSAAAKKVNNPAGMVNNVSTDEIRGPRGQEEILAKSQQPPTSENSSQKETTKEKTIVNQAQAQDSANNTIESVATQNNHHGSNKRKRTEAAEQRAPTGTVASAPIIEPSLTTMTTATATATTITVASSSPIMGAREPSPPEKKHRSKSLSATPKTKRDILPSDPGIATRKSSRIAAATGNKRKANIDESEAADATAGKRKKLGDVCVTPSKRGKVGGSTSEVTVHDEDREATLSIVPPELELSRITEAADSDRPEPLSSCGLYHDLASTLLGTDHDIISASSGSTNTNTDGTIITTVSPRHPPTTTTTAMTMEIMSPPTRSPSPSSIEDLEFMYPFLSNLSSIPTNTNLSLNTDTDTNINTNTNDYHNAHNNDNDSKTFWLKFLYHFGRSPTVADEINAFFDRNNGATETKKADEFLTCLERAVGRIRRVDGGDGEKGGFVLI